MTENRHVKGSYWLETAPGGPRPPLTEDLDVDVAVIGAGIAGLSTAWELTRAGRRGAVLEAGQAFGLEAAAPLRHGVLVHAHHGGDLAVGHAVGGQQHDPGPLGGTLGGGVGTDPALQLGPFGIGDPKRWHGRHAAAPHAASLRNPPYVRD